MGRVLDRVDKYRFCMMGYLNEWFGEARVREDITDVFEVPEANETGRRVAKYFAEMVL